MRDRRAALMVAVAAAVAAGCVSTTPTRARLDISADLLERTGNEIGPAVTPSVGELVDVVMPAGVRLDDGLSRDEAVAMALWANPTFQADVAGLGFAQAELAAAGMLPNPVFSLLFPWGPKQLELTLRWPVEALWLRPRRVEIAHLNVERVAASLVENGLTLVSEVKIAYADLVFARADAELSRDLAASQREFADLTAARLRAGDVSGLEAGGALAVALTSQEDAIRSSTSVVAAKNRLAALIGIGVDEFDVEPLPEPAPRPPLSALGELITDALAARPDVRAAELAIEAAGKKAGLTEKEAWTVTAALDANGSGSEGFEMGPGLDVAIPIFDRNQGPRSAAEAELDVAAHRYVAVRADVELAVRQAHADYLGAQARVALWGGEILPALEEAAGQTARAVELGDVSYLDLVIAQRAIVEAERRKALADAELDRAEARLEKALGRSMLLPPSGAAR